MDRFVAMVWDGDDVARPWQVSDWSEALQRQSTRWTRVIDQPGLVVFAFRHRGEAPVITRWVNGSGIVLGPLFARGQEKSGRILKLSHDEQLDVVRSRGQALLDGYWGNYVAIWRDEKTRKTTIVRDPCAAVPCFMTCQQGVQLLFAHAEDIAQFRGLSYSVDWEFLRAFLYFDHFITKFTGVKEITELLAGERLEMGPIGSKRFSWVWNAAEIAAKPQFKSFAAAADELRATAEECFRALGTEYREMVVRLSGGLDSSIVLNLMRRVSDARIVAIHALGTGYEQFEDQQARLSAAHAGVEYVAFQDEYQAEDLRRMLDWPRIARPSMQMVNSAANAEILDVGCKIGADAFLDGHGGDNLFLQRGVAEGMLADYVRHQGLGKDFWRVAYDAASLRQEPVSAGLVETARSMMTPRDWRPYDFLESPLVSKHRPLTAEMIAAIHAEQMQHEWVRGAASLPRGKAAHVVSVLSLQNYHSRLSFGLEKDALHPFYCQPITEWALRTPTYLLAKGGIDRALERAAFADVVPESVVRRTGKGAIRHRQLLVAQRNHEFRRALILNGAIVKRDWIDAKKLDTMLTPEFVAHGGGVYFLDRLLVVEAWLNLWRFRDVRIAA